MHDVVALALGGLRRRVASSGPDEQIDDVLVALIDERRDRAPAEIIEAPAGQRKARRGEILDGRRKIELAVEPRLDGVAVLRGDILEMTRLQRPNMAGDDFFGTPGRHPPHDPEK